MAKKDDKDIMQPAEPGKVETGYWAKRKGDFDQQMLKEMKRVLEYKPDADNDPNQPAFRVGEDRK